MMPVEMMERLRTAFRAEALDLLLELDSALLLLESETGDTPALHRVFRAIHTLKGSGASAGFDRLTRLAHKMEDAFDRARCNRLPVTPHLIDCGLRACDLMRLMLTGDGEGAKPSDEAEVVEALADLLASSEGPPCGGNRGRETRRAFRIVFRPDREVFRRGSDPVRVLDGLRELGQAHITAHAGDVPPLNAMRPVDCYLWWEALLATSHEEAVVQDLFAAFNEGDVQIRLVEDQAAAVSLLDSVPGESLELFLVEAEEQLGTMDEHALALESEPASKEELDSLFRSVHSLKSNAGLLLGHIKGTLPAVHPLHLLIRVTHTLESALDKYRDPGSGTLTAAVIRMVMEASAACRDLVNNLAQCGAASAQSMERIERLNTDPKPAEASFLSAAGQCIEVMEGCLRRIEGAEQPLEPALDAYRRALRTLSVAVRHNRKQGLDAPLGAQSRILQEALDSAAKVSAEQTAALRDALQTVRSALPECDVPADGSSSPGHRAMPSVHEPFAASTLRVDQAKLDRLMGTVGELLVARGALPLLAAKLGEAMLSASGKELLDAISQIGRIADELQSNVMAIRMLPVKSILHRFPRLVRDLARSLGKDVRLLIEGEDIELDKMLLDQLGDPLVHLVRNAVSHGLESPAERLTAGKDAAGQLTLRVCQTHDGVVIEVADDGRGLDAARLKASAVDRGLLVRQAAAVMSDEAAYQLVFVPGLSTAPCVNEVSGRGVGMDVVRTAVRAVKGSVSIQSRPGKGTSFFVRLPSSLMVSKGILLTAGGEEYVLPLSGIREMVKIGRDDIHDYGGLLLARVRTVTYPVVRLAAVLGLRDESLAEEAPVAIVEAGALPYGLIVDRFLSDVEVLIKPLPASLQQCREFMGVAILGDGRAVLVLDAQGCQRLGAPILKN